MRVLVYRLYAFDDGGVHLLENSAFAMNSEKKSLIESRIAFGG